MIVGKGLLIMKLNSNCVESLRQTSASRCAVDSMPRSSQSREIWVSFAVLSLELPLELSPIKYKTYCSCTKHCYCTKVWFNTLAMVAIKFGRSPRSRLLVVATSMWSDQKGPHDSMSCNCNLTWLGRSADLQIFSPRGANAYGWTSS